MNGYGVCEATENFTAPQWQEPSSFMAVSGTDAHDHSAVTVQDVSGARGAPTCAYRTPREESPWVEAAWPSSSPGPRERRSPRDWTFQAARRRAPSRSSLTASRARKI